MDDWYLDDTNSVRQAITECESYWTHRKKYQKIILTTDQDLIKDGVQAIDDDFLEWFVKNPSCEEVEVAKTNKLIDNYADKDEDKWEVKYHIYFPKEEPKQETLEEAAGSCAIKENRSSLYELGMKYFMDGAKWQQEKMYSEEEVVKLLIKFNQEIQEVENVREWFEEFKKK